MKETARHKEGRGGKKELTGGGSSDGLTRTKTEQNRASPSEVDLAQALGGSPDHPPPISQVNRHPRTHKDRPKRPAPPDGPCVSQQARPFETAKADLKTQREVSPYGISFSLVLLQCRRHVSPQRDSLSSTLNNKTFSIPPASDRNPANCLCSLPPAAPPLPPCLVPALRCS